MQIYQTKVHPLPGTSYSEIKTKAQAVYKRIASRTKRRPYIRSLYFNKEKIFLDYFWEHIRTKNLNDRVRRLKYYACAIDLILNSRLHPVSKQNSLNPSEILHRFAGKYGSSLFFVQIKEDFKTGQKIFISVFPSE